VFKSSIENERLRLHNGKALKEWFNGAKELGNDGR
jgi:hypothetical protein